MSSSDGVEMQPAKRSWPMTRPVTRSQTKDAGDAPQMLEASLETEQERADENVLIQRESSHGGDTNGRSYRMFVPLDDEVDRRASPRDDGVGSKHQSRSPMSNTSEMVRQSGMTERRESRENTAGSQGIECDSDIAQGNSGLRASPRNDNSFLDRQLRFSASRTDDGAQRHYEHPDLSVRRECREGAVDYAIRENMPVSIERNVYPHSISDMRR